MELFKNRHDIRGFDEIYSAIDTYDMAAVVRAALEVLRNNDSLPVRDSLQKSSADSSAARKAGNEHYKAGRHLEAIQFYNQAIAFAPFESEELILALGNRSAVFFTINYFSACYEDANDACRAKECPADTRIKLEKRRGKAQLRCFQEHSMYSFIDTDFLCNFMSFKCTKNAEVPCASNDIAFVNRNGTKLVTARNNIKAGTLVAIERAFSSSVVENKYQCCYFCHKMDLRLHPCKYCSKALFCSIRCRNLCWKEYHRIECQELDYQLGCKKEEPQNKLCTRSAIKLSLKLGWNALIEASKDIGASRMKKATEKQMYNHDEPLSILSYDDRTLFIGGKIFFGSLQCAAILHCLDKVADYFPKEAKLRDAARDAMARIMLHLLVTFKNTILIRCSAFNLNKPGFKGALQTNYGWFSMSSKLKHSCVPNLMVMGLNDSVGLVALRTIAEGEELTISYIGHFYDHPLPNYRVEDKFKRAVHVLLTARQMCQCKACKNNWDGNSAINVQLTKNLDALIAKVNRRRIMDYKSYNRLCIGLDNFPINSIQHKWAYEAVKGMFKPIQSIYVQNKTYWV